MTVSTNHNLFEEKGEPQRYLTEVLPLTSLPPYSSRPNRLTLEATHNKQYLYVRATHFFHMKFIFIQS